MPGRAIGSPGQLVLRWAARSHTGRRRSRNEDSVLARPCLFAVADGMGGHAAGDLASRWTVEGLSDLADREPLSRLAVVDAVRAADERLRTFGRRERIELGTTVCALAVTTTAAGDQGLGLLNVGDSRAYRLRGDDLERLTRDHSVVQDLIDRGTLSERDAGRHPDRNVVTRSLGGDDHLEIDWWNLDPSGGDRYLLATDGLTGEVTDAAIAAILSTEPDVGAAADSLVLAALTGGGRDNVSVIVVDVVAAARSAGARSAADPLDGDTQPRPREARSSPLDADTEPTGRRR